jgi:hypothetical protein
VPKRQRPKGPAEGPLVKTVEPANWRPSDAALEALADLLLAHAGGARADDDAADPDTPKRKNPNAE